MTNLEWQNFLACLALFFAVASLIARFVPDLRAWRRRRLANLAMQRRRP